MAKEWPSHSNANVARIGVENSVDIFDVQGEKVCTYYGHRAGVYNRKHYTITSLAWSKDEACIVSFSSHGSLHIWDARRGVHLHTLADPLLLQNLSLPPVQELWWSDEGVISARHERTTYWWKRSQGKSGSYFQFDTTTQEK